MRGARNSSEPRRRFVDSIVTITHELKSNSYLLELQTKVPEQSTKPFPRKHPLWQPHLMKIRFQQCVAVSANGVGSVPDIYFYHATMLPNAQSLSSPKPGLGRRSRVSWRIRCTNRSCFSRQCTTINQRWWNNTNTGAI